MPNYETDTDTDDGVVDFYGPRKQNCLVNAKKRLQCQRENAYVDSMLGSLHSVFPTEEEPIEGVEPKATFDPREFTNECIRSWRGERKMLSSSINEYIKQRRVSISSDNLKTSWRDNNVKKFRPEPNSTKLNTFLNSIHSQLDDAVLELKNTRRPKHETKDEDILRRPSQLVRLEESDAGTDKDELRNARKDILKKLSKQCAYWMVHENTPYDDRVDLEEELTEAHGHCEDKDLLTSYPAFLTFKEQFQNGLSSPRDDSDDESVSAQGSTF